MSERHVYITPGISRDVFTNVGCRMTSEDDDLTYYIHQHGYSEAVCNHECTYAHMGKVERVTQSADAKGECSA